MRRTITSPPPSRDPRPPARSCGLVTCAQSASKAPRRRVSVSLVRCTRRAVGRRDRPGPDASSKFRRPRHHLGSDAHVPPAGVQFRTGTSNSAHPFVSIQKKRKKTILPVAVGHLSWIWASGNSRNLCLVRTSSCIAVRSPPCTARATELDADRHRRHQQHDGKQRVPASASMQAQAEAGAKQASKGKGYSSLQ